MIDYRQKESHFLNACDVVQVDATTKVSKALLRAGTHRYGGIIVRESDRPAWLINGRKLAEEALKLTELASNQDPTLPMDAPISDFLPHGRIGTTLNQVAFPISPTVQQATVEDGDVVPLGDKAKQKNIYVIQKDGHLLGFLFSNEDHKVHAATTPPTYICKRNHVNRDPDHGRCSFCPAKLTLQPA